MSKRVAEPPPIFFIFNADIEHGLISMNADEQRFPVTERHA